GDWAKLTTVPANTQIFADRSLGGGLHISYRVRAISASGASDWSNVATVDVPTAAGLGAELKGRGFGSLLVGSAGPAQNVTLTNPGTAPLVIDSLALSGANPGDFSVTASATTIAPGEKLALSIVFNPSAAGNRSAVLTINSNAPGGPQTLELAGD